jgi:predicted TIM-barrel fold metal-dependent hydrolase
MRPLNATSASVTGPAWRTQNSDIILAFANISPHRCKQGLREARLREKMLFSTDFPLITPERWLDHFQRAGFKREVQPLIPKQNATRLLGLGLG